MPKYYFHVVGIRHHDFEDRLEELYAKAEGKCMSLHLEEENVMEKNAVRVHLVSEFVGYVASGEERELAEKIVRGERLSVMGRVVEINREYRNITLEVNTDAKIDCKGRELYKVLKKWDYKGELLRQADEDVTLKGVMNNLQMHIEQQMPCNNEMTQYLDFIEKNLWRDAGVETHCQLDTITHLLTANSDVVKGYVEAVNRLRFIRSNVNSPESRQHQVDYLYELSQGREIHDIIHHIGLEAANKAIDKLPKQLVRMFDRDPQEYAGHLWYMPWSYKQLRKMQTLTVMRIALKTMNDRSTVEPDDILIGGVKVLDNLALAVNNHYQKSNKNLALIYCVLRDNNLLVDEKNYRGFVELLVYKNIIPWMNENKIKDLAYSISQYMRDRKDHNKIRKGFNTAYAYWEECKEKQFCQCVETFLVD